MMRKFPNPETLGPDDTMDEMRRAEDRHLDASAAAGDGTPGPAREAAAKAIHAVLYGDTSHWDKVPEGFRDEYRRAADAALLAAPLAAPREPTDIPTAFDVDLEICEKCGHHEVRINDETMIGKPHDDGKCTGEFVSISLGTYCPSKDDERHRACAEQEDVVLQVLCRAFDDDLDTVLQEWREFYGDGSGWMWWARGLGGFIGGRNRRRALADAAEIERLRAVPSVPPSEGLRGTFTVREMAGALCPECQKGADVHREPAQFATGDAAYWHHTADPYGPACPAASLWEYAFFAPVPSVPAPPSEEPTP